MIGDNICRGCKRYAHEVICWNRYRETEKQLVLKRLDNFLYQVLQTKLQLLDEKLLQQRISAIQPKWRSQFTSKEGEDNGIETLSHRSWQAMAFELLRLASAQIKDLPQCGLAAKAPYQGMTVKALADLIDDEFLQLSAAHYQRYICPTF